MLSWSAMARQLDVGFTMGDHFDSLMGVPGKNGISVIEYGMIDNYVGSRGEVYGAPDAEVILDLHILPDADCAPVLDATPDADYVPEFNVTQDADDFRNLNDNPDAVLDFDFPLITLEDSDGNVDNDEVSNVSPSSNDISEASVSSGETFLLGDLDSFSQRVED